MNKFICNCSEKAYLNNFVISAIISAFINGNKCKPFKDILNGVQTKGNGEINTTQHNYSKNCILILYKMKGLNNYQNYFTIKKYKIDLIIRSVSSEA